MNKIILYYKFVALDDPEAIKLWQRELCTSLELKGRIILSTHGINGTLGGEPKSVKAYVKAMEQHPLFAGIDYKWSDGTGDEFPKLSVKVRKELVTLNSDEDFDPFNTGTPLKPAEWKKFIEENPDAVILDGRNKYESDIGKFKGAIAPEIETFREIKDQIKHLPKDKPVLTYCTGDIRCEYLSAYMKHEGFEDVYHLDGGIVKYGQEFGDDGLWEGKCFVFDQRMSIAFSDKSKDIGECTSCGSKTSRYIDCANLKCHELVLMCDVCADSSYCVDCV